ncbi:MAG: hypothetical protein HYR67_14905 [Bacteroidetes bacterium]|nr:hypothetical protein [Bacteroidota bacterium]
MEGIPSPESLFLVKRKEWIEDGVKLKVAFLAIEHGIPTLQIALKDKWILGQVRLLIKGLALALEILRGQIRLSKSTVKRRNMERFGSEVLKEVRAGHDTDPSGIITTWMKSDSDGSDTSLLSSIQQRVFNVIEPIELIWLSAAPSERQMVSPVMEEFLINELILLRDIYKVTLARPEDNSPEFDYESP